MSASVASLDKRRPDFLKDGSFPALQPSSAKFREKRVNKLQ